MSRAKLLPWISPNWIAGGFNEDIGVLEPLGREAGLQVVYARCLDTCHFVSRPPHRVYGEVWCGRERSPASAVSRIHRARPARSCRGWTHCSVPELWIYFLSGFLGEKVAKTRWMLQRAAQVDSSPADCEALSCWAHREQAQLA